MAAGSVSTSVAVLLMVTCWYLGAAVLWTAQNTFGGGPPIKRGVVWRWAGLSVVPFGLLAWLVLRYGLPGNT